MKGKVCYLEKYSFFDCEPVKLFEKWFNLLMFTLVKNDLGVVILNFVFETAHLIRGDVNE